MEPDPGARHPGQGVGAKDGRTLVLVIAGTYGVVSYAEKQRVHETETRFTGSMVYGISPPNSGFLAAAAVVLVLVAVAAIAVPVKQANGVDPLQALRVD